MLHVSYSLIHAYSISVVRYLRNYSFGWPLKQLALISIIWTTIDNAVYVPRNPTVNVVNYNDIWAMGVPGSAQASLTCISFPLRWYRTLKLVELEQPKTLSISGLTLLGSSMTNLLPLDSWQIQGTMGESTIVGLVYSKCWWNIFKPIHSGSTVIRTLTL